jgi:hypothetical protein
MKLVFVMEPSMTASTEMHPRSTEQAVASLGPKSSPQAQRALSAIGLASTVIVAMPLAHGDEGHRHGVEEWGAGIESMMRMHEDHAHDGAEQDDLSDGQVLRVWSRE